MKLNTTFDRDRFQSDCALPRLESAEITRVCIQRGLLCLSKVDGTPLPLGTLSARLPVLSFTDSSRARMRKYLRNSVALYQYMITLTYPWHFDADCAVSKNHLRRFMQELRRYIDRHTLEIKTYSTFWFLEFQDRGAPHYHLLTTHTFPKGWVASTWASIVNSDDPRHITACSRIEKLSGGRAALISYVTKYAEKSNQKVVPKDVYNVGRFWGISGLRETVAAAIAIRGMDVGKIGNLDAVESLLAQLRAYADAGNDRFIGELYSCYLFRMEQDDYWLKMRQTIAVMSAKHKELVDTFHNKHDFMDCAFDIEYDLMTYENA